MNILDIAIIVIVGTAFVMSLFRGALKEVFSFGAVIAGFLLANQTYDVVGIFLSGYMQNGPLSKVFGYALVFVGAGIVIRLIGTLLEKWTKKAMLGWANHMVGSVFGFLKGCLIVSVIIMLITSFLPESRMLRESKLTPHILSVVGVVAKASPREMKRRFAKTKKDLEKNWGKKMASIGSKEQREIFEKLIREESK